MDNSPQLCDPRPHAHRRDEPPRFRPLPRRLRVLRRGAVHAVVRVLAVRDPARVASRLARRRRAGPSDYVARRDRGAFAHQRGRHGGEEDGARGDAQGGAREGCRAGGGGGDGGGARVRAREQLIVRSYVMRFYRAVALSNAVAFARFGREKKSERRGIAHAAEAVNTDRFGSNAKLDERRRGGAPRQSEALKKQFVSHTSAALDFVSWCFSTTFADHRDVLATALTRFARRSAPLSRADDF